MEIICEKCTKILRIDGTKVPDKGGYARCPKCHSRIFIRKKADVEKQEIIQEKITCPKCGYQQSQSDTCLKCGLIFSKWHEKQDIAQDTPDQQAFSEQPAGKKTGLKEYTKLCPSCGKEVISEDGLCSFCGESNAVLSERRKLKVQRASKWIIAISIMFLIFGTIHGFMQKSVANKALNNISRFNESQVLETPINGKKYTVGDVRSMIGREVMLAFLVNYFLAAVMFALYLWARRSPFPAMVAALCVYIAVVALNAIIDPKSLVQGTAIKIIFIVALIAGVKVSYSARRISEP